MPERLSSYRNIANYVANQKNRLIVFELNGASGFIEALPNYEQVKAGLLQGTQRSAVTAVMVGEIAGKPANNFDDLATWFPIDYLHLLGISTGSEVGAPWIELRDKKGELVRRLHVNLGSPSYVRGHRAIDEVHHRATGQLLSQAALSSTWGMSHFRVVLRQIVRGGFEGESTLEERLGTLCRALETLCNHFGLDKQDLTADFDLGQKAGVSAILRRGAQQIMSLATTPEFVMDPVHARSLQSIASRIESASGKAKDFGIGVTDLLRKFGLPDADIVDAHFRATPRPDGRQTWSAVLSYYRGVIVHEGYFDLAGRRHDIDEIWTLRCHLHDILIRVMLKQANYQGKYNPTMSRWKAAESLDWVNSTTSASRLGY